MQHFLIVYRRSAGRLLCERSFGTDHHSAAVERSKLERQYRHDADVEVIVLTASSSQALRRTHSRYFKTLGELIVDLDEALARGRPAQG